MFRAVSVGYEFKYSISFRWFELVLMLMRSIKEGYYAQDQRNDRSALSGRILLPSMLQEPAGR